MKKSIGRKNRDNTAFLYERISRDDNLEGDSDSVVNQKKLLTKVAKEKGFTNLVHFFDDGISGVTMERPGFQKMLAELEQGHAAAVIVKDMSRLGRNYIEVGRLTEEFFPDHDIRLIAVSDASLLWVSFAFKRAIRSIRQSLSQFAYRAFSLISARTSCSSAVSRME